uniref:Branched-chain-amino-acid aminotransferase n=1 Tax=Globodera rostochiensis TaxID=31243 RepID=A0A914IG29_GLORO
MPSLSTQFSTFKKNKQTFFHNELSIVQASGPELRPKPFGPDAQLKFGQHFSDHMMEVDWSDVNGWDKPLISPLHALQLHPGAKALHYAIELFEGMKAYRGQDKHIRLFRPEMNIARMKRTAARLMLPDFDGNELLKIIEELVRLDQDWVPNSDTASLYIRPTMIGTDATLVEGWSSGSKLFVVTGPTGSLFNTSGAVQKPIALLADPNLARTSPGGVGQYKMGCNYAPGILISKQANELGCHQVLWLEGDDEKITEVGAMNIFVFWKNEAGEMELVTPPLDDGLILPGVVRDSLLVIAREWGEFRVRERYPTMAELKKSIEEKRLRQIFACGTACVVAPVGRILYIRHGNGRAGRMEDMAIPVPSPDEPKNIMERLYKAITDIYYGRMERQEWTRIVV